MSVGPLNSHEAMINGNLTVILTDGGGNVKSFQKIKNQVSFNGYKALASAIMNGDAITARYIHIFSGAGGANPTQSMASPFSAVGVEIHTVGGCLSGAYNAGTFGAALYSWAISGTFTFSGEAAKVSVDGAALLWGTAGLTASDSGGTSTSYFAHATFGALAITSVDKLTFIWAFSLSGTISA